MATREGVRNLAKREQEELERRKQAVRALALQELHEIGERRAKEHPEVVVSSPKTASRIPSSSNDGGIMGTLGNWLKEAAAREQAQEAEETSKKSDISRRYNIDPDTFGMADFEQWAEGHNFARDKNNITLTGWDSKMKRKEGSWFEWEKLTTPEDEEAMPKLYALAQNNEARGTAQKNGNNARGAVESAATSALSGATLGAYDRIMGKISDSVRGSLYDKLGYNDLIQPGEEASYSSYRQQMSENHPVASGVGEVVGSLLTFSGADKLASGMLKNIGWLSKGEES